MIIKKVTFIEAPYTENGRRVPTRALIPYDWKQLTVTDVKQQNPSDMFNRIIVFEQRYKDLEMFNYLSVEYDAGNRNEIFYGWIDKINPIHDGNINKQCVIFFHIDYWRTYIEKIVFNFGIIVNRPPTINDPPQYVPTINENYFTSLHNMADQDFTIAWVYLNVIKDERIRFLSFPVALTEKYTYAYLRDKKGNTIPAPSLLEVMNGNVIMAIHSKGSNPQIVSCCISSISPVKYEKEIDEYGRIIINPEYDKGNVEIYSIKTIDLINQYGNTIETATFQYYKIDLVAIDNKHTIERDDSPLIPQVDKPFYRLGDMDSWVFPQEPKIIEFTTLTGLKRSNIQITFEPSEWNPSEQRVKTYFPPLQWLKYFHSRYNEIVSVNFSPHLCYFGNVNWEFSYTYDTELKIDKQKYKQIFNIDESTYVIKVTKSEKNKTLWNAKLSDGSIQENIEIKNIWMPWDKEPYKIEIEFPKGWYNVTDCFINEEDERLSLENPWGTWTPKSYNLPSKLKSTPLNNLYLLDNSHYPIHKFSQGRELVTYSVQAISLNSEMSILIKFNDGEYIDENQFIIRMTPIDMNQSYLNEYITTGQREEANAKQTEAIISSLANIGTNALIGAIAGPGGILLGAGSGIAHTAVTGALNKWQQSTYEERLKNKGSFLLRNGGDYSWIFNGYPIGLGITTIDTYSRQRYKDKIKYVGIDCNEIDRNGHKINTLIMNPNGGPLRILEASIYGTIPIEGRRQITEKLANGVYMDKNLTAIEYKPDNIIFHE